MSAGEGCSGVAGPIQEDPDMLRQVLRVVGVEGGMARLEASRASACQSCNLRKGCGMGAANEILGAGNFEIELPAEADLHPGDRVVVAMPSSTFLRAAALSCLLPPVALALAVSLARAAGTPDLISALLCVPVLGLSLLPLWRAERRGSMQRAVHIESVLPAAAPHPGAK